MNKLYTEDLLSISIYDIVKNNKDFTSNYKDFILELYGYKIRITTSRLTYGLRYWFLCPSCIRRVGKLYFIDKYLVCRFCSGSKYADQDRHRNKYFEKVIRPLKKMRKIEQNLEKRLRNSTKRKLIKKYQLYANRFWES